MSILVIGGGKMGMSHLALASRYVGKSGVALCEQKRLTRLLFGRLGYRAFASVDAAAAALPKLDGILIATPTPSHAALAEWAIARGIPFFVEKPLTLNVTRSAQLVKTAAAAGVPAQVGFVLRYVATFQHLRRLVAGGRLGRLQGYVASMRGNVVGKPLPETSWQGDFRRGGGCLNEYGPHIIDLCRFIFGPVGDLGEVRMEQVHSTRADDRIFADWQHLDGPPARLEVDWCDPSKRKSVIEFRLSSDYAELRADNSGVEITWHEGAPLDAAERAALAITPAPCNIGFFLRGEEFSLELEAFLGLCLGRNFHVDPDVPTETLPTLADGYEVDLLIDRIAVKAGLK